MLLKELGYAVRSLAKTPAFALTAVFTIALGVGASTAIFSVVNGVLLRRLPYAEPERLVLAWGDLRNRNVLDFPFPPGDIPDIRAQGTLFEGFAGVVTGRAPLTGDDQTPEQVVTAGVTPNTFTLLGLPIALGRGFTEEDGTPQPRLAQQAGAPAPQPGAQPPPRLPGTAVLSHEFWKRRYGGDRSIIGKTIDLQGKTVVVGVLAPGAELLFPPTTNVERWPDVWIALRLNFEGASRINVFLRLIGRLKPGVTVTQAQSQMDGIAADLRKRFPIKETAGLHFRLEPMQQDLVADVRPAILALMGAVIFVLLISCANVANLLLVRAARRERELALRSALGGTRWRLVRQMLTESLVLAVGGGVLGLGLAWLGIRLLASMGPASLPRLDAVAIDPLVLVFSAGASLAAAVIFGVVPALRASRPNAIEALRPTGRASGGRAGRWLRDSVVMVEVALSFVLLIGSGLMFRSFLALVRTDPGYDPAGILTFSVPTPRGPAQQRAAFIQTLHDRLAGLPGVQAVTAATPLPLDGLLANARWGTEAAVADPTRFQQANLHMVLPGYFEALRTRLLSGRVFTAADNDSSVMSLIVDDRLAAKAFPGRQAVGQRLYVRARGNEPEWYDIIGVVAHQRHVSLTSDGPEAIFLTDGHMGSGAVNRWAVRTAGNPTALAGPIRAVVTALDPLLPVSEVQPMTALVDKAMAPTRFALVLIGIFAAIAGVLAVVGLYGVLSSSVSQRTAEIGVRVALGAPRSSILQLVIGQGLRLSGVGIGLGLVGAFALTRVINTMLVGVKATDPLTFGSMVVIFFGIAWFACWVPARRAAGLDPTVALRED